MTGKFIDMFCGMGTIRMGFEQAGWGCVSSVEFDKHKRKIYEVIFGHEPEFGDITTVRGADLPFSDCWCFGAPCQDFSVAGLRAGLDGNRSGLVREVFRILREKDPRDRPEWLLYENVKGMLSSNLGWDFAAIQAEMGELGYDVQWQLLNSKDFGVPQNRERVYTLGHLRARGERKVFPIGADCEQVTKLQGQCTNTITARYYGAQAVGTYIAEREQLSQVKQIGNVMPTATRDNPNQGRVYDPTGLAPCLNKMEGGGREPLVMTLNTKDVNGKEPPQQDRVYSPGGLMTALSAQLGGRYNIFEPCACLTPDRAEKRQNGRRFKNPGEPMFTLTKQDIHGIAYGVYTGVSPEFVHPPLENLSRCLKSNKHDSGVMQDSRIRRLTPRECMRLQGVPDHITDKLIAAGISDTQMYRAAGDACTVNVIYEIAKRLYPPISGKENKNG